MAISLQHQDTFNRSDGSLHGSAFSDGLGQWSSPPSGQINVDSNRAVQASNISDQGIFDSNMDGGTTDQRAVVEVLNADTGPIVRHNGLDSGSEEYYLGYFASLSVAIYIRESGGFTLLGTAGSAAVNDDVGLEVIGDDLQAYVNGSPLGSPVTNATLTAGRCGMYFGGGTGQGQDNFEAWWDPGSGGNVTVEVPSASLTTATFAPTVTATDHKLVTVPVGTLTLALFAPTVTATDAKLVEVPAGSLVTNTFAPNVTTSGNQTVEVPKADLTLTTYAPDVVATNPILVEVPRVDLTLATFEPTVSVTTGVYVVPAASLILTTFAPSVASSEPVARVSVGDLSETVWLNAGDEVRFIFEGPAIDAPSVILMVPLIQEAVPVVIREPKRMRPPG